MKKNTKLLVIVLFAIVVLPYSGEVAAQKQLEKIGDREYQLVDSQWIYVNDTRDTVRFSPQRIIVHFRDHTIDTVRIKEMLQITDLKVASGPSRGGYYVLHVPTDKRGFEAMRSLKEASHVESATFSIYGERLSVPNDPRWSDQWNLPKVNISSAWDVTRGNPSVIVAIIDSGARLDHEDLANSLWSGVGYDFLNPSGSPTDSDGHGTAVSGIIGAATDNGSGIAGIAGRWDATSGTRLMILKDGNTSPLIDLTSNAIEWAADNGATVINLSTGYPPSPGTSQQDLDMLEAAVDYAVGLGVTIVASAGNNGGTMSGDKSIRYPARYSNTIAVGATLENDSRWETSSSGSAIGSELDLMAPGGAQIIWTTNISGGYFEFDGTSASAPQVAGVAALLKSVNPNLTPSQIQTILRTTADWLGHMGGSPPNNNYGYGRLNAYKAVKEALPSQYDSQSFGSNVTLNSAHFAGSNSLSSGVTLTLPTGKVAVLEGTLSGGGSKIAVASGAKLIIEGGTSILGADIEIASGGELLIRPGSQITLGTGSAILSYAKLELDDVTLTWDGSNRWDGLTLSGSGVYGTAISNSVISRSVNGVRLISATGVVIEDSQIQSHQNNGLYASATTSTQVYTSLFAFNGGSGMYADGSSIYFSAGNIFHDNNDDGIAAEGGSWLTFGYPGTAEVTSMGNDYGVRANGTSYVELGGSSYGGDNLIRSNTTWNARAQNGSFIEAQYTYWGPGSPATKISADGTSTVDYSNWLSHPPFKMAAEEAGSGSAEPSHGKTKGRILGEIRRSMADDPACLSQWLAHSDAQVRHVAQLVEFADLLQRQEFDRVFSRGTALLETTYDVSEQAMLRRGMFVAHLMQDDYAAAHAQLKQLADLGDDRNVRYLSALLPADYQEEIISRPILTDSEAGASISASAYPNPFNPATQIRYTLPEAGRLEMSVYDVTGRLVQTLNEGFATAGSHEIRFDGSRLASGMYLFRITLVPERAGSAVQQFNGKMLLMK